MAADRKRELAVSREEAKALGRTAIEAVRQGFYVSKQGERVEWRDMVVSAQAAKRSVPPDVSLDRDGTRSFQVTQIQVTNETTLQAARRFVQSGLRPLALNFANGVEPGGGFLDGARAQEEVLCRSSALAATLFDDPMYEAHRRRPLPDSTDWAIYSPDVPVFREDGGAELPQPWMLSFVTCAAPYAPTVGQPQSGDLLARRIQRVLTIAESFGHSALVLGAWGCGAFANDPNRTAADFREAFENEFAGAFSDVVFAIVDWSPERRFLGPFRDVFARPAPFGISNSKNY